MFPPQSRYPGNAYFHVVMQVPPDGFHRLDLKVPGEQLILTKGDNNHIDDIELYQGLDWLERKHIVGKVRG